MSNSNTKYRPYFTAAELQEIIRCCKSVSTNHQLIKYLEGFALKISHSQISPSLALVPTMEEKLGISFPTTQQIWPDEQLYNTWKTSPETLTPLQIKRVHLYRYTNDLMNPKEEADYEQQTITS